MPAAVVVVVMVALTRELGRVALPLQRRSVALIEPGEGTGREAKEHRRCVARGTRRGRDAGIVARTKPGDHQRN